MQEELRDRWLNRTYDLVERLAERAPAATLARALEARSDIGGLAAILSDLAPLGFDASTVDPFAELIARGAQIKLDLLERAGGALTSEQVARALGVTRQAVDKRRKRGTLLAVPVGSGEYQFPACQFNEDGVVDGVDRVLAAFEDEDPWLRLSVLAEPSPALRGMSVIEVLRQGDIDRAVGVVAAFGT